MVQASQVPSGGVTSGWKAPVSTLSRRLAGGRAGGELEPVEVEDAAAVAGEDHRRAVGREDWIEIEGAVVGELARLARAQIEKEEVPPVRRPGAGKDDAAAVGREPRRVDLAFARIEEELRLGSVAHGDAGETGAPLAALHEDGGAAVGRDVDLRAAQAGGETALALVVDEEEIAEGQIGVRHLAAREKYAAAGHGLAISPLPPRSCTSASAPVSR